jgi:hypothetical protein
VILFNKEVKVNLLAILHVVIQRGNTIVASLQMKLTIFSTVFVLSLTSIALADTVAVSNFAKEGFSGWESKSFKGTTDYRIVREGERTLLKASSSASASGLYRKIKLDPQLYRYLNWTWKVTGPLKNEAEKTKGGDDYSARVYVMFPGFFFWQTKAISYVWAGCLPKGESYPNPYTDKVMMIVAQSGPDKSGNWVAERHDILADYRRLFRAEPRNIGAIAIMTDTDNTGGTATAWYGEITLSNAP